MRMCGLQPCGIARRAWQANPTAQRVTAGGQPTKKYPTSCGPSESNSPPIVCMPGRNYSCLGLPKDPLRLPFLPGSSHSCICQSSRCNVSESHVVANIGDEGLWTESTPAAPLGQGHAQPKLQRTSSSAESRTT